MDGQTHYTLIPMQIEAVMISDQDRHHYANINPNFNSIKMDPSGESIEASPFTLRLDAEEAGIHIHWILPSETTHGVQEKEGGAVVYPPIPNRYLVTRLADVSGDGSPKIQRKTWIVESDSITSKRNERNQNSTTFPASDDLRQTYRFLGECREFAGEITEGTEHLKLLHACISGSPYYAAYYPMCRNVLGFHDSLEDLQDAAQPGHPVSIDYVVTGWYEEELEQGFPDHIYHGLLYGLLWEGSHADYPSGIPVLDNIAKIAIGSSTEQAMAALVAFHQNNEAVGHMVESLMENSLQDWGRMDGIVETEYQMHDNGFGHAGAGRMIDIQIKDSQEETQQENQDHNQENYRNALLWSIQGWQTIGYEMEVEKKRLQQETADLWRSYTQSDSKEIGTQAKIEITARARRLYKLAQCYKRLLEHTGKKIKKLKGRIEGQVQERIDQRFYIPNNPAAVLEGAGKNSLPDGGEDTEHTRTEAEIRKEKDGKTAQELLKPLFAKDFSKIPQRADTRDQEILDIAQSLIGEALLDKKHLPYGVEYEPGWNPLILEWELEFYPDSALLEEQFTLENWTLEGLDFVYNKEKPDLSHKEIYNGRTMLSTHASQLFKCASERFLKVGEDTYQVKNMPYQVLSQALSGFRDMLIMRRQDLQYPLRAFPGLDAQLTELAANCVEGADTLTADYDRKFYSVLAGFVRFTTFHVIDTFGRVQIFRPAGVITPAKFQTREIGMHNYFAMPPRLTQPARIFFQWRDAKTDVPCLDTEETSPICGWIWPNFAESSLLVYADEGNMLGSICMVYDPDTGHPETVWRNAPGERYLNEGYPDELLPEMRQMLDGMLASAKKEPDLLYHILQMLDECFWNMHCADVQEEDSSYAVLGYPVAVARAGVALQLQGKMLQEPVSLFETKRRHASLEQTDFPLRFGNTQQKGDGVIGFYDLGEDMPYDRLHVCGVAHQTQQGYLSGGPDISIKIAKKRSLRPMLFWLSPYGSMHLFSGILPVKTVRLPRLLVSKAMKHIYATLYCAPVFTPAGSLAMPCPHTEKRKWSYLERRMDGKWEETEEIHSVQETVCFDPVSYELREGWMKQVFWDESS